MRIALIVDKHEAYIAFERDRLLSEWGIDRDQVSSITSVNQAGHATLFGAAPLSVLSLNDKDEIQSALAILKDATPETLKRLSTPGLIMHSNANRNTTRSLEKTVSDLGGVVLESKGSSKNDTPTSKIIDTLFIAPAAKKFLKEYIGDDYTSVLGLVRTVGKLSPKHQAAIGIEDLLVRLPQPPGAVPPWGIEPAILSGDVNKAIELYRRVSKTSHLLVVLSILKNKFYLVYKVAAILDSNPNATTASVSKALSPEVPSNASKDVRDRLMKASVQDNYALKLALGTAKKIGLAKATGILELIASTEAKVKGGSSGDPHIFMERMIVSIATQVR